MNWMNIKTLSLVCCVLALAACDKPSEDYQRTRLVDSATPDAYQRKSKPVVRSEAQVVANREQSRLSHLKLSFERPDGFKTHFYEDPQGQYSTIHMLEVTSQSAYPINMSLSFFENTSGMDLEQATLATQEHVKLLNDVQKIKEFPAKVGDDILIWQSFEHSILFPPYLKDAPRQVVYEQWAHFQHANKIYEFRLKADPKDKNKATQAFQVFIHSLHFDEKGD